MDVPLTQPSLCQAPQNLELKQTDPGQDTLPAPKPSSERLATSHLYCVTEQQARELQRRGTGVTAGPGKNIGRAGWTEDAEGHRQRLA